MVRIFADQAQVMAHQQDGHMVLLLQPQHGVQEQLQALLVHPGNGFVQHQQIRGRMGGQGQQHPLGFTAGAASQGMPGNGRGLHPRQGFHHLGAGLFGYACPHGTAGEGCGQKVLHRQGHLLVKVQVLGDIARAQVGNIPSLAVQVVNAAPVGELAQQRAD